MASNGKMLSYQMDLIFSVILFGICIFIFKESLTLPKSTYEIVGTSFLPKVLCILLCICAVLVFIEGLQKRNAQIEIQRESRGIDGIPNEKKSSYTRRPNLAFLVFLVTVLYIGIMSTRTVPYDILTPVFIFVLGMSIFRREKKGSWLNFLVILIITSIFLGMSLNYIFKNIFITDLF
jgi:hypothetical protein